MLGLVGVCIAAEDSHQFGGEAPVVFGSVAHGVVFVDCLAKAGGLSQFDVASDGGFEDAGLGEQEVLGPDTIDIFVDVGQDFAGQGGAAVEHAEEEAAYAEPLIEALSDHFACFEELAHALEGEEMGLKRDQDVIGGNQGVERKQTERGWAIDEDVVVILCHGGEGI